MTLLRHRNALAIPFALLALTALVGGALNGVDARGRLIDGFTDDGVKEGSVSVGQRRVFADAQGSYAIDSVPRTTTIRVDAPGYARTSAPAHGGDVRMNPLALTVQVNEESTAALPPRVPFAQVRQDTKILGTANQSGNMVITPHPGKDSKVIVCAKGFETAEFVVKGVNVTWTLKRNEAADCPALPTPTPGPSPSPGASPSPSPAAPTPSPTPRPP